MAFTTTNGRTRTSLADINITPLVDVVLVLLVIFMITAPVLQSGIEVAVPKTRTVKEITEQRLVVTIDRDQQVFLGDQPVNIHDLAQKLRQAGRDPAQAGDLSAGRSASALRRLRQRDGRGETGGDYQHFDRDPAAGYEGDAAERELGVRGSFGFIIETGRHSKSAVSQSASSRKSLGDAHEQLLEGSEQLERELTPEPVAAPAAGLCAALALLAAVCSMALLVGSFITTFGATRERAERSR